MGKDDRVGRLLNDLLKAELTAANQYFLHSVMCESRGYRNLAAHRRAASIHGMGRAQWCVDHILLGHGRPAVNELCPIRLGITAKEQIENDLATHTECIPRLHHAMEACAGDAAARELFHRILLAREDDVDSLEAELHTIREVGIDDYLAAQVH